AGVAKRKRVAYWMLVAYFTLQLAFDVFILIDRDDRGEEARRLHVAWYGPWAGLANLVVTLAVLGVLAKAYREFYATVQRASLPRAIATLATLIGLFTLVGWGLVEAFPGSLPHEGTKRLVYSLRQVSGGAFGFDVGREGDAPGWVNLVLGLFGALALFAALYA